MNNTKIIKEAQSVKNVESMDIVARNPKKIIVQGLLLPKDKVSRNGVLYDWKGIVSHYKKLTGLPMLYNHLNESDEKPIGKFTKSWIKEQDDSDGIAGWYYEADINPTSKYADSILRGDLSKVSIQVIANDQKTEEAQDGSGSFVRAYINDVLEASVVPTPGFMDTNINLVYAESFKINKEGAQFDKLSTYLYSKPYAELGPLQQNKIRKLIYKDPSLEMVEALDEKKMIEDMTTATNPGASAVMMAKKKEGEDPRKYDGGVSDEQLKRINNIPKKEDKTVDVKEVDMDNFKKYLKTKSDEFVKGMEKHPQAFTPAQLQAIQHELQVERGLSYESFSEGRKGDLEIEYKGHQLEARYDFYLSLHGYIDGSKIIDDSGDIPQEVIRNLKSRVDNMKEAFLTPYTPYGARVAEDVDKLSDEDAEEILKETDPEAYEKLQKEKKELIKINAEMVVKEPEDEIVTEEKAEVEPDTDHDMKPKPNNTPITGDKPARRAYVIEVLPNNKTRIVEEDA